MNGFVLAGGLSTRMGRDKALLEFEGGPLIARMVEVLRSVGLTPRICGAKSGSGQDLSGFAEVVPDNFARCGPLGGIEAALAVSDSDQNLFVPVDLPRLPREFLGWMVERAGASHAVATIPHFADRPQPLCAVYSRRLLPGLRQALADGHCKVMTAIQQSAAALSEPVDEFHVESVAAAGPADWPLRPPLRAWFSNVNTPADLEALAVAAGANRRHPIS